MIFDAEMTFRTLDREWKEQAAVGQKYTEQQPLVSGLTPRNHLTSEEDQGK